MLCATDFLELAISGCFLVFQRTRAPFSCHVRAHQHVFALQCAVSASEWNFCAHFLRTFIPFWPDFGPGFAPPVCDFHVMYCSSSSFLHTKVQFRPQSGIFVHTFIPFWPDFIPFWPDFVATADIFMSCTCTPARFCASMCSFGLRVEFCVMFFGPFIPFWPDFGPGFAPPVCDFVTEVHFSCHVLL